MDHKSIPKPEKNSIEDELLELAKKELLRETKCASMRAEQFGAHSWAKPQRYVPSKRFLEHMLVSTSRENERKSNKWRKNRMATDSSAVLHSSQKYEHSRKKDKHSKHKPSRWDTETSHKHSKSKSSTSHNKGEKKHSNKTKHKRSI